MSKASAGTPRAFTVSPRIHAFDQPDVMIFIDVANSGHVAAHEVAQLYVAVPAQVDLPTPIRSLQGFQRLFLHPGESRRLRFRLSPLQMATTMQDGSKKQTGGVYTISVGGHQPGDLLGAAVSNCEVATLQL